jgi:TPR repeat protein
MLPQHLWFRKAAEQGYAPAQSNLGTLYLYARGVTQDDNEAVIWFRKAADQGDAVAEFLLGNQYANGKGAPEDHSEAIIWFQKAAGQHHPVAMLYLGVMYAEGRGVPQDYVRAYMWFSLSAAQGEQRAVKTLEMAAQRMTPNQINQAQKLAHDWKPATFLIRGVSAAGSSIFNGQHGQVRFAIHCRPRRQLTEILLVMVRSSLI